MVKKNKAVLWFLLSILTLNISVIILGEKFDLYKEDGWYTKWYCWALAFLFGIVPVMIMLFILTIQMTVKICIKFGVSGKEIYGYPYIWVLSLIVPIIGWALFIIMFLYIYIMYIIGLFQGKGEY